MKKEQYAQMQKLAGFKVGDKVEVVSKCPDYHMGWGTEWHENMKIGQRFTIHRIHDYWGIISEKLDFYYPFFVLRKLDEIKIGLNSDYEAIVTENEVIVGCQKFTHDKILEVAEAIKKIKENKVR